MTENLVSEPSEAAFEEDLVVALPHQGLVEAELADLQIRYDREEIESDEKLGLALLRNLKGMASRAAQIRVYHSEEIARQESRGNRSFTDLDAVLFGLRRHFAERFGGWVPEMGKNRQVAGIVPAGPGGGKVMGASAVTELNAGYAGSGTNTGSIVAEAVTGLAVTGSDSGDIVMGPGGKVMAISTWKASRGAFTLGPGGGKVMGIRVWWNPDGNGGFSLLTSAGTVLEDPGYVYPETAPPSLDGTAGTGIRVGVLDTPLYPNPALAPHLADRHILFDQFEPRPDGATWQPLNGHATFVTYLVAREAPGAKVDLRAVLQGDDGTATAWDTATAMMSFASAGNDDTDVDILNLSLGCRTADGQPPLVLTRAVERLSPNVVVVAAAGNHGVSDHSSAPVWPAALPNVVAVGAAADDGGSADFSPKLPWVTLTAPGVKVLGAYVDATVELSDGTRRQFDGWARWSGTSFAAATVSGVIAANTAPGQSAQDALSGLLTNTNPVVRKYVHPS